MRHLSVWSLNCHLGFDIRNLLGPALSFSRGNCKNLEGEYEDDT